MASLNSETSARALFTFFQSLMFLFLIPPAKAVTFNYPFFDSNSANLSLQGNASIINGFIQLTANQKDAQLNGSIGRAVYAEPVRLWISATGESADFDTGFSFIIKNFSENNGADGLAFFIAANGSTIPPYSGGDRLGLYNLSSMYDSSKDPVVAVEFDTFPNRWDPSYDHVGIDVNSIVSVATWDATNLKNGSTARCWVSYNSSTKNLSVYFSFAQKPDLSNLVVSHIVNLRDVLPEWVSIGFSAATGTFFEIHNVLSWEFNSTDFDSNPGTGGGEDNNKNGIGLVIGLVVGGSVLVGGLGLILFLWRKKRCKGNEEEETVDDMSTDDEFEKETGPKRFTYTELDRATNKFAKEGKLGEGGFGGVYRGILNDSKLDVAVKRFSRGSGQGKKEFVTEVKIISRLRHRNLVQLMGWCHEPGEFIIVYEFMPNGSLDTHLFHGKTTLTWALRYKIALGLASALLYLHEEWGQCVVHRDIKSSNIMLDSSFNAKLGDFGLARLVDHELGMKTTMLAGTMGYLAPECFTTGKASKESDVYSFGVVALEIACGRKAVEHTEEESKVGLVAWVWELYGSGKLLEAVDARLGMDFDEQEILQLMVVGLWCANLDYNLRPSMRQAISVLKFEAPLPILPSQVSMPTHIRPSKHAGGLSQASSSTATDSKINHSQCSCSSCATNSSQISIATHFSDSSSLLHSAPR